MEQWKRVKAGTFIFIVSHVGLTKKKKKSKKKKTKTKNQILTHKWQNRRVCGLAKAKQIKNLKQST